MPNTYTGLAEGFKEGLKENKSAERERANLILKAMLEGQVTPKQNIQPQNIGQKIMSGLGIATSPEADVMNYNIQPNLENQVRGENLKYLKNINSRMTGENEAGGGANLIARKADTGEAVDLATAQQAIAKGDRNYIINQVKTTKAGTTESPLVKSPDLTKEEKDYVILSNQVNKSLDSLTTKIIPKLEKGEWKDWQTFQAQSVPFLGIRNQEVQDFKSFVNDLKMRIPFLRGGKQLTPTEAARVDALLNPLGQTSETYKGNIQRLKDEFLSGEGIMIGGASALSRQGQPGTVQGSEAQPDFSGKQTNQPMGQSEDRYQQYLKLVGGK